MHKNIYVSQARKKISPLTSYFENFSRNFTKSYEKKDNLSGENVKVSQTLGSISYVYEKIRNSVEYKGENVIRRNAVERILKRLLWEKPNLENVDFEKVSSTLLKELVQAKYLQNDTIPVESIGEVAQILSKFNFILKNAKYLAKSKKDMEGWLIGIASSEIEDLLDPSNRDLFVDLMHHWFMANFTWNDDELTEEEKSLQVYLAVHRSYTKSDDAIMRYHLLTKIFLTWNKNTKEDITQFIDNFSEIYGLIEKSLSHPKRFLIYRKVKKSVAPFDILHEVAVSEKTTLNKLVNKPQLFEENIRQVCLKKYQAIKTKTRRSIQRSVVYIFVTKIFIALLVEIPIEIYLDGSADIFPLVSNVLFPPFLMILVGSTIKTPGEKNTDIIVRRIQNIVYQKNTNKISEFALTSVNKGSRLKTIFSLFYLITFLVVFMLLAFILSYAGFSVIATLIFFAFLSLVLLFVMKIKLNANEIKIYSDEGTIGLIFEVLSLPFLNLGMYLSQGFSKLNIFSVILDFLIEAPLKSMVEVLEEWFAFIRKKRDEVVDVP
ncbi:hypothetical protein IPM62_03465 [Candidatus Woesebacteria bacterium]|nr:MAG: hypothetical protein IPM62_03465 [Candidatus Woesebacteria bacterium]